MKLKKLILLVLLFIAIGIALSFLMYFTLIIDAIRIIPMDIELHPSAYGINGDADALHFGRLALFTGAYATKFINITNSEKHSSFVSVSFSGDMASWTDVEENNFVLRPGETKELKFIATPPEDAVPGNYTGKAKIVIKRMWN